MRAREPDDRGATTVETAIVLLVLALAMSAGMAVVMTGVAYIKCVDAAREGARLAARDDPAAERVALDVAPDGAAITIKRDSDTVEVQVAAPAALPGVRLRAEAHVVAEPASRGLN